MYSFNNFLTPSEVPHVLFENDSFEELVLETSNFPFLLLFHSTILSGAAPYAILSFLQATFYAKPNLFQFNLVVFLSGRVIVLGQFK